MQPIELGVFISNAASLALHVPAAAAVRRRQVATGRPLPPSVPVRVWQQAARRTVAPPVQAPVPKSAAGPVIELDPGRCQVQGLGQ